jgi:hypothetical protein
VAVLIGCSTLTFPARVLAGCARSSHRDDDTPASGPYGLRVRILIIAAVIIFLALWVRAVIDVYQRRDLSTSAKAAWAIIMLIFPFVGLLIYTMLRPGERTA